MRIEVKTCNNVRILLDVNTVKSQRQIVNGEHSHYQITLVNGKTMDLSHALVGITVDPSIDISPKLKENYLNRLSTKVVKRS